MSTEFGKGLGGDFDWWASKQPTGMTREKIERRGRGDLVPVEDLRVPELGMREEGLPASMVQRTSWDERRLYLTDTGVRGGRAQAQAQRARAWNGGFKEEEKGSQGRGETHAHTYAVVSREEATMPPWAAAAFAKAPCAWKVCTIASLTLALQRPAHTSANVVHVLQAARAVPRLLPRLKGGGAPLLLRRGSTRRVEAGEHGQLITSIATRMIGDWEAGDSVRLIRDDSELRDEYTAMIRRQTALQKKNRGKAPTVSMEGGPDQPLQSDLERPFTPEE
eukprot:CAMPEP_0206252180 /NCGR_PEP_ID=MMETSP0047_2-20121206/22434_1 /ASSEMBLY_ACC=CAM_ASM_000192 /TAXON_ID=195065 /ORGANISM="Chroomonas mesostigmatica_cf, Strain CCMP1168" /LENGTH=277 /DNA_ID=CAMNT_0053678211 /DNA_START=1 /DNA_END=833 /DNA_ORIENTATION=-